VERRHVPKTYGEKRNAFGLLKTHVDPDTPVAAITRGMALSLLQEQFDNKGGYAANKIRKNLAAGWNWGAKYLEGWPVEMVNPFRAVEKFPEKRQDRYVPPEKDFWEVWEAAGAGSQDQIMLTAYLHLAARKSELFRLKWKDVNIPGRQVRLFTRKTKDGSWEAAWIPMTDELAQALEYWWRARPFPESHHVFTVPPDNQYEGEPFKYRLHWMRRLCARVNKQRNEEGKDPIKPFGLHAIRHLSASILYHEGIPVATIQAILRHKSPNTTERYLKHLGLDPYDLQKAMEKLNDRGEGKGKEKEKAEVIRLHREDEQEESRKENAMGK
jgi:integrase